MPLDDAPARFERLLVALHELAAANERAPVLVEGARDAAALRALGCRGDVVPLQTGARRQAVVEALARHHRDVVLMLDFDPEGERQTAALAPLLAAQGVRADGTHRRRVREALSLPLKDVESLAAYVARAPAQYKVSSLEEEFGGTGPQKRGPA